MSSIAGVIAGALGILDRVADLLAPLGGGAALRAVQNALEHKFYFDELYDLVFYKPSVFLARSLAWFVEAPLLGSVGTIAGCVRGLGVTRAASRPGSSACTRWRSRPASPSWQSSSWRSAMITALILIPVGGALLLWLMPFSRFWTGAIAFLISLVEVGLWIDMLVRFDFSGGIQFQAQQTWFSDLNVSYHVGFYGFSLWLAGLTVVVMACAIGYAFWTGRERPRAYFGLMLLLTGAVIGVFASLDLLLFYAFWEGMLIPLYVLVGVWGGPGRMAATLKFVIYTMVGSLLMLASIIVFGLQQGTFDLISSGTSSSIWIFLGFAAAFAVKAPLFPFHGWLPDAYRESSPEVAAVLSGVISKAAAYGFLAIAIRKFPGPTADAAHRHPRARGRRARVRVAHRVPRARLPQRRRLLEPGADGADHARALRGELARLRRRRAADGQPRADLGRAVPARGNRDAPHHDRRLRLPRRDGQRQTRCSPPC